MPEFMSETLPAALFLTALVVAGFVLALVALFRRLTRRPDEGVWEDEP